MAIPDYETLMLPLLTLIQQRGTLKLGEVADALADSFKLTPEECQQLLPSGLYPVFRSRVGWAKTYLKQAGLVQQPRRGEIAISDRGKALLAESPVAISNKLLVRYPEFRAFKDRSRPKRDSEVSEPEDRTAGSDDIDAHSPEELIESAIASINSNLRGELLEQIAQAPPSFFEELVVKLLLKMGYGGSRQEAGAAVGRSGDGGIDGVINEDRLGLDAIYVQAKRWANPVGEREIRDFKGALDARGASKGVFITTSQFTPHAKEAARNSRAYRIVLIDGHRLSGLLVEHGLGVSTSAVYEVKKLDGDFFSDD